MKLMMITGAGISVGSNLPTYRGENGRYTEIEAEAGMSIERLLSNYMLASEPERVWAYWLPFSMALKEAIPSASHQAIRSLSESCEEFLEFTQNVDGLSRIAGVREDCLIEIHGTYRKHHCRKCKDPVSLDLNEDMEIPPLCKKCGDSKAVIRPDVVMFGESISGSKFDKARAFAATADLLVIAGTSLQFDYLGKIVAVALERGIPVVYIDPEASPNKSVLLQLDYDLNVSESIACIRKEADEVLPDLAQAVKDWGSGRHDITQWIRKKVASE